MPRPSFFNDNENRTFPFREGSAGVNTPATGTFSMQQLPDDVIVDCGFITGPESGFVEGEHSIYLYSVHRVSSSVVTYEFRSTAPKLAGVGIVFQRTTADLPYKTEFVESGIPQYENSQPSGEPLPPVVCGEPLWSGYLVTGPIEAVTARLTVGFSVYGSSTVAVVEPALIQNLAGSRVVSINIANADRTRAVRPSNCPPNAWSFELGSIHVQRECLQGALIVRPGYNTSLGQVIETNTLQFSAVVNAGAGQPCQEIKQFPAEAPPEDASNNLLTGDFYCNEVFRSINGLQGPDLTIIAGTGVTVTSNSATNTVLVDINLTDLSTCTYTTPS